MSKGPATRNEKTDEKEYIIKRQGEICGSPDRVTRIWHLWICEGDCMTRGPQPLMAIHGAQEIAPQRGVVLDKAGMLASHYDFIIFEERCTVFVRVKRIRASHLPPSGNGIVV
jgi:hypothetical protein